MAFIGLKHPVWAPITQEGAGVLPTYGTGLVVGKAMTADVAMSRRDQRLDADDELAEYDNGITGGTIGLGVDDVADSVAEAMLGDSKNDQDEYMETDDGAVWGGFGYYRERRKKGVKSFIGYWYPKTMWAKGDENAATKSPDSGFQTPTLNGVLAGVSLTAENKTVFRIRKSFDTEAAALAWVDGKGGISK